MTKRAWVIADTHFSHAGVCNFLREDGSKLRPWDNPDDMDRDMVQYWNALVPDKDRVYVLGDVAINKRGLEVLGACNGKKILVKGNHDIFKLRDYLPFFEDIRACVVRNFNNGESRAILTHIPIHTDSVERFSLNIHGHLHERVVKTPEGTPDPRYACVSVERINFAPRLLEDVMKGKT